MCCVFARWRVIEGIEDIAFSPFDRYYGYEGIIVCACVFASVVCVCVLASVV